jgi:cell division protein FtsL
MSSTPVMIAARITGVIFITRWYHQTHQTLLRQQQTMDRQKNHIGELEEELLRLRREMRICTLYDKHFTETDVERK